MTPVTARRCIACWTPFQPRGAHHRLCRSCYRWHAFGIAVEAFVRRQREAPEVRP
jgi:hypothetical protein